METGHTKPASPPCRTGSALSTLALHHGHSDRDQTALSAVLHHPLTCQATSLLTLTPRFHMSHASACFTIHVASKKFRYWPSFCPFLPGPPTLFVYKHGRFADRSSIPPGHVTPPFPGFSRWICFPVPRVLYRNEFRRRDHALRHSSWLHLGRFPLLHGQRAVAC